MRAQLMSAAALTGDPDEGLKRAYGLHGRSGDTDGYAGVHLGHIVEEERRTIEQYGHRADFAFLSIDNIIANGFNSWLWDGRSAIGGWAAPGPVIVQVRSAWTSGPLSALRLFTGGAARQRLLARQSELAARDLAILQGTEVAYLPGLADRIQLQVADQVGARVRAAGGSGADLRRAFLAEYWRATFHQFMLIHEGRHALDRELVRGFARLNDGNLEYRAKLSELALADYPRLAFLNINDTSIGGGSGHGRANERLLREYAAWISAHAAEVAGFDPGRPALVQIDKLTDDQIRAIARSLDPIARP